MCSQRQQPVIAGPFSPHPLWPRVCCKQLLPASPAGSLDCGNISDLLHGVRSSPYAPIFPSQRAISRVPSVSVAVQQDTSPMTQGQPLSFQRQPLWVRTTCQKQNRCRKRKHRAVNLFPEPIQPRRRQDFHWQRAHAVGGPCPGSLARGAQHSRFSLAKNAHTKGTLLQRKESNTML